ncbi:hypothetical protein CNYM01_02945 [Colletotrichum nymphaeae SA-01]|uniref:Uncharacterized protein n=1 Tax=Colletotrichum nymphaeae SA-01 TaxID=1460502 RepID=A0A135S3N9_9PEZI|nr:hypothetical protein CNYM01_02945 [Colletotrichum nymphaeae SA-01]
MGYFEDKKDQVEADFDDVRLRQFESFISLLEDDGVKQGNMSDIHPEPAQLTKFNTDAPLADEISAGLLAGSSIDSQESCGATSVPTAL